MSIKFSIVIPTYNRANFIAKTIESVLNQSYKNFELIVVDDGSNDKTEKVVNGFKDHRVKYFKIKNSERGAARNFGAKKAQGEYLNFLDSDDLLYDNHLTTAFNVINEFNCKVFALHYDLSIKGNYKAADYCPKNNIINYELIKVGNFLSCNSVFLSKEIFENSFFNEDRRLAGSEDYELWLRIAARYTFRYFTIITSSIVFHDERSVVSMSADKLILRKKLMLKYLDQDEVFVKKYGKYRNELISNAFSYISLHLVLDGQKMKSLRFFLFSILKQPNALLKKRSLAIIKRLIF